MVVGVIGFDCDDLGRWSNLGAIKCIWFHLRFDQKKSRGKYKEGRCFDNVQLYIDYAVSAELNTTNNRFSAFWLNHFWMVGHWQALYSTEPLGQI